MTDLVKAEHSVTKRWKDMGDGTHAEVVYVANGGGGGGGGGASGDVTAAGVSGTSAQAIQGITGGVEVGVNAKGKTFYNSANNNANITGLANASFGQLAAGAQFQGTWEPAFNWPAAQVLGGANQPMMYTLAQALDAAGTDIVSSTVFYRGSGEDLCENIQINGNYFRVTAKNIGTATTAGFEVNTTYGDMPGLPQALSNVGNLRVAARETQNFTRKLRDNFQSWPNANWPRISKAAGDIIQLDGNVSGCGYLVMSLDPLTANTESFIESDPVYNMPVELAVGLGTSQRTYGQELAVQVISNDAGALAPAADVQILNIQQATTTLTINTSAAHNMRVGQRFGIYGVSNDSRLNYAALVVASTPTATQLTATAGPQGTIGTLTVGPFSPASAFMYLRDAMSWATNGTAMVMENANSTNASFYVKAEAGDAMPIGGTLAGNHSVTTLTSASTQAVAAALNYAFRPTDQFMCSLMADRVQWTDSLVDTSGQANNRATVSQVVPHPDAQYVVRISAKNRSGLTIPVGKITSAAKTGTTTATVVCPNHGLTTGDYVNIYGCRDQTNFANLTTATVVASVVDANTFTIIWGAAVTATGCGGYVSRVQGQQTQQGAIAQAAQSYSITGGIMTVVGNTTWAGLSAGDYINLHGCRVDLTGADAGIDGTYRVRDFAATNLILEPIGSTTIPATQSSVNIGGGVIKRTDLRLSFARLFDFERLRVESLPRPAGDSASATPVVVQTGTVSANQGTGASLGANGTAAWIVRSGASRTTDVGSAAITATSTGSAIDVTANNGAQQFTFEVTAVSGTSPRMYPRIQESFDGGTNWVTTFDLPPVVNSTDKTHHTPVLPVLGTHMRYVRTLSGTTPSFTNSVTRTARPLENPPIRRQLVDRVVSLTATTASTDFLYVDGCKRGQIVLALGAATTAPTLKLQVCDDIQASAWYDVPSATVAGTASTTVASAMFDLPPAKFARLVPTVAGSGITADTYTLMVKAWA